MRKLCMIMVVLMLMTVPLAHAVTFTPAEIFELDGLEVVEEKPSKSGVKWCALSDDKSEPVINFSDGKNLYRVNNNTDMDDESLPASNIAMSFIDFCRVFDFDAYYYRGDNVRLIYAASGVDINRIFKFESVDYRDDRYDDKSAFVSALEDVIYKPDSITSAETILADTEATDEIRARLVESIQSLTRYEDMLYGCALDRVEVNPNYGTAEGGDFIGLVYIAYDKYTTPKDDYNSILRAATNIATMAKGDCPEIIEYCVFIELPAYDSQAKCQFLIEDGQVQYGDVITPAVMAQ